MVDGKISGNTARNQGGGICVDTSTFTMNGGEISGNKADYGGGVSVYFGNATFSMNGGEIFGNTTTSAGGGVYVRHNFIKSGGTITGYASDTVRGNVVKNSSDVVQSNRGHAVYVESPVRRRETTAGPGDNMDSTKTGAAGGWEN
jgi:predicted outer membrane repeat protein